MIYRSKLFKLNTDLRLTIDLNHHVVNQARFVPSPNYDLRPHNTEIDLLVIHCISLPPGEFNNQSEQYITDLFLNKLDPNIHPYFKEIYQLKLSCHSLINRKGSLIQYVPFNFRAWHAGVSYFNGKEKCNDFSIGIELEGIDHIPYTKEQYQTLIALIKLILKHYPKITPTNIVGHCHIAPSRKTDPGDLFDWELIRNNL
jgi:N-acetyl-anhydromuramoyl-L-alanine amidase